MQFPIHIGLRRSRFLELSLLLVALAACGAALTFPAALLLRLLATGLIGLLAFLAWRRLAPQFSEIRLERDGRIAVWLLGGSYIDAEIQPGAVVHPWLTIVRLRDEAAQPHLLIVAMDSLAADDFRRLRVFLRWQAKFSETGGAA